MEWLLLKRLNDEVIFEIKK